METKQHYVVDGWVDEPPAPGAGRNTALFDLVVRPDDIDLLPDDAPDTVIACTSAQARITRELLTVVQPGDLVRVTGTLTLPQRPGVPARLTVDVLEVLDTGLIPVLRDMVMDRYGVYVVVFDAGSGTDAVPVFTEQGEWVGLADNPDAIADLIELHERVHGIDT